MDTKKAQKHERIAFSMYAPKVAPIDFGYVPDECPFAIMRDNLGEDTGTLNTFSHPSRLPRLNGTAVAGLSAHNDSIVTSSLNPRLLGCGFDGSAPSWGAKICALTWGHYLVTREWAQDKATSFLGDVIQAILCQI